MRKNNALKSASYELDQIDQSIRAARVDEARQQLNSVLTKARTRRWPAELRARAAELLRRTGQTYAAVRWLHPYVRPDKGKRLVSHPDEIIEYAASLVQMGAQSEGLALLKIPEVRDSPRTLLFTAFAHQNRWDYSQAAAFLEAALAPHKLSSYESLIAQVNLCGAYTALGDTVRGLNLVRNLAPELRDAGYHLLLANVLGYQAEMEIQNGRGPDAIETLESAERKLVDANIFDRMYLHKWKIIAMATKTKTHAQVTSQLRTLRDEAFLKRSYETARDCDFHLARLERDIDLAAKVFLGTPYPSFRARITKLFSPGQLGDKLHNARLSISNRNSNYKSESQHESVIIDPRGSLFEDLQGSLPLKLFELLTLDSYRPMRLANLFAQLFPDEFFNPFSAPNRLQQVVSRLRALLKERKLPVMILASEGGWRLQTNNTCVLTRVYRNADGELALPSRMSAYLESLTKLIPPHKGSPVTRAQIEERLKVSPRLANQILAEATNRGLVNRQGSRSLTRYTWV